VNTSTVIEELLEKIKLLEIELIEELQKQQEEFRYEIRKRQVYFAENIIIKHKQYVLKLMSYLLDAPLKHILVAPFIWMCLVPALLMDIVVTVYQSVCFPVYGIPKVKRQDYLIFDRQYLHYLNLIEKINCAYCSYFNGLIAYIQEIAARTEQFWCPIKHAQRLKKLHSRYQKFIEYGDAEGYRAYLETVRHNFKDLD
jgi:hypothetical protein